MKRFLSILICVTMMIGMTACGKTADNTVTGDAAGSQQTDIDLPDENTTEGKIARVFLEEMEKGTSPEDTLQAISSAVELGDVVEKISEGYLNGFSQDINGFSEGYMLAPMIGSIPFVCYIFETDDVEGLKNALLAAADPMWNICTQANDPVAVAYNNYVMITMTPAEE